MQTHICSPGLIPEDIMGVSLTANSVCPGLASDAEINWYETGYISVLLNSLHCQNWVENTHFASWEWYANA